MFGSKTILLCGDFRQTLPVIPQATRLHLIENFIVSWDKFQEFHKCTLRQNMRVLPQEIEFVEFLNVLGNGTVPTSPQYSSDTIEIPQNLIGHTNSIINDIYGDLTETIISHEIVDSVILAPKKDLKAVY